MDGRKFSTVFYRILFPSSLLPKRGVGGYEKVSKLVDRAEEVDVKDRVERVEREGVKIDDQKVSDELTGRKRGMRLTK